MARTSCMRLFAKKGHSADWIKRHVSDRYVQKAQQDLYRSRAAYKLKQMDNDFSFLSKRSIVVDLGCFAGGWSQVALERIGAGHGRCLGMVIGVDKVRMEPLDHHHRFVLGDVQEASTIQRVQEELQGRRASVVLSDMAPKMTGSKIDDHMASVELCRAAHRFAEAVLCEGGWYLTKIFAGALADQHRAELGSRFQKVRIVKPPASRSESPELYFLCKHYLGNSDAQHDSSNTRVPNTARG
mmetsp:Transcript_168867/g.324704  ORF Transcript_168867/g.324704 Transcript_168867/m.324704 type:complete len:241 (+) Transcript_168867:37-759(+)